MGHKALTWAWEAEIESPGAKFVLVALADHASNHSTENWTCFPSIDRLVSMTGQGERTVRRHLDWLEEEGLIARARRRRDDGSLGIYDYTLLSAPDDYQRPDWPLVKGDQLPAKNDRPTGQKRRNLPAKLAAQEPSRLTVIEPSERESGRESDDLEGDLFGDKPKAKLPAKPKPLTAEEVYEATFDEWWDAYPLKVAKGDGRKAYLKAVASIGPGEAAPILLAGAKQLAEDTKDFTKAEKKWIPHPATWLNGEEWTNEPGARARSKSDGTGSGRTAGGATRADRLEDRRESLSAMLNGAVAAVERRKR